VNGFDFLILGGGPAGCVLAARLSEDPGCRVALVEAGPDYGPRTRGAWPAELLDATAIPESHDWRDRDGSLPWARVIGGCSSHNACAVTRAAPAEYDAWSAFGGDDWRWATLGPCLSRARTALGASQIGPDAVGMWDQTVLDAARESGFAAVNDLDDQASGAAIVASNTSGVERVNAAFAYLDPARSRPNLTVLDRTLADRVLLRAGRASGALVHGSSGPQKLASDRVVLAAGGYGSPAILMRSGIGPEDELRAHGIRVRHLLRGVGAELADHCRIGLGFELREDVASALAAERSTRRRVAQTIVKWRLDGSGDALTDGHLLAIVPPDRSHGRITVGLFGLQSFGRVGLRSVDPAALPRVDERFLSNLAGDDLARLVEGSERARELVASDPLRRLVASEQEPGPSQSLAQHARATAASFYHPTGTCRMGAPDDSGAVVDGAGRVHGLDGLLVADASIIPISPRAGTHLTTLAVAERVAELTLAYV
jgi:choline dehydrogenase